MKYTIEGLQQSCLIEWKLDSIDAVIIRFVIDFFHTEKMKKIELDGVKYFWIHYNTVLEELPILNIKKQALSDRFKKYVDCGLMDFKLEKTSQGTFSYYRFIESEYEKLIKTDVPTSSVLRTPTSSVLRTKYTSTNTLSKDKVTVSNETETPKISVYLNTWNKLKELFPMIQQHNNPETKVYKNTLKMIKHLRTGNFGDMCHVDPDFREKNHIPNSMLHREWTKDEIIKVMKRLPLLFVNGYWPPDKSKLPKDLSSLIYNPLTNTSWFFYVAVNKPSPINKGASTEAINNAIKFSREKNKDFDEKAFIQYIDEVDNQMMKK